jgi:hypothetical protein
MLVLRADPWLPEYGMGFDVGDDAEPPTVDAAIETDDWTAPRIPWDTAVSDVVTFVDGVRRAEVRLLADQDGQRGFGLFGTYAVGTVRCDGQAAFGDSEVGRVVALGSGLAPDRVTIRYGNARLEFAPVSDPREEPQAPLLALQDCMRRTETEIARNVAVAGDGLVLCDGPIGFLDRTPSPLIGVIKRFSRPYLDAEREALLPRLSPGERTPIFGIEDRAGRMRLFSWYVRIAAVRPPWHGYAGLVRCEVSATLSRGTAIDLADQVATFLPRYAGHPSDPRAPQNLAPIGGLETWLRHRMGDPMLVRRALLSYLCGS